jgi:hypothetical protein
MENGNFRRLAANGNLETAHFHMFSANEKREVCFFGLQTINSNQRLLLQPTCPSILVKAIMFPQC